MLKETQAKKHKQNSTLGKFLQVNFLEPPVGNDASHV